VEAVKGTALPVNLLAEQRDAQRRGSSTERQGSSTEPHGIAPPEALDAPAMMNAVSRITGRFFPGFVPDVPQRCMPRETAPRPGSLYRLSCLCDTDRHRDDSGLPFDGKWIMCDMCEGWAHAQCYGIHRVVEHTNAFSCGMCRPGEDGLVQPGGSNLQRLGTAQACRGKHKKRRRRGDVSRAAAVDLGVAHLSPPPPPFGPPPVQGEQQRESAPAQRAGTSTLGLQSSHFPGGASSDEEPGGGGRGGGGSSPIYGQCQRNPLCTRGYKHGGKGGHCALPPRLGLGAGRKRQCGTPESRAPGGGPDEPASSSPPVEATLVDGLVFRSFQAEDAMRRYLAAGSAAGRPPGEHTP